MTLSRLGLPGEITACLFDMDGVLTATSTTHARAWKETFDGFLRQYAADHDTAFVPFDADGDYAAYVDGKRRLDGVRDFLASRNIELPEGDADDDPSAATIAGIGNRKNQRVQQLFRTEGVATYPGSIAYVRAVRDAGLATAVVSSSANTAQILDLAGIAQLFDARVDGVTARRENLAGKPAPDMFLRGAAAVGVRPERAAVFEDALSGVAAGRAGGFGYVVGVDRLDQADALRTHGADTVVEDLAALMGGEGATQS